MIALQIKLMELELGKRQTELQWKKEKRKMELEWEKEKTIRARIGDSPRALARMEQLKL